MTTPHMPIDDCRACRYSFMDAISGVMMLRCRLTRRHVQNPCLMFEREPGSDVEEYIALQDGHVQPDQGRGD